MSSSELPNLRLRKPNDGVSATSPAVAPSATPFSNLYFRIYDTSFLTRYDYWVLNLSCSYIWRVSTRNIQLPFFASHFSASHLDIGVGTGYFPATSLGLGIAPACSSPAPRIALWDLSSQALATARERILSAAPGAQVTTIQANATQPLPPAAERELLLTGPRLAECNGPGFDSISAFFLLHCIPGDTYSKTQALARNAASYLNPSGVFFGSTIVWSTERLTSRPSTQGLRIGTGSEDTIEGDSREDHGWFLPTLLMWVYNQTGILHNKGDNPDAVIKALEDNFESVESWIVGTVLLFRAKTKISRPK